MVITHPIYLRKESEERACPATEVPTVNGTHRTAHTPAKVHIRISRAHANAAGAPSEPAHANGILHSIPGHTNAHQNATSDEDEYQKRPWMQATKGLDKKTPQEPPADTATAQL